MHSFFHFILTILIHLFKFIQLIISSVLSTNLSSFKNHSKIMNNISFDFQITYYMYNYFFHQLLDCFSLFYNLIMNNIMFTTSVPNHV